MTYGKLSNEVLDDHDVTVCGPLHNRAPTREIVRTHISKGE
jgi:hypothetical protein